jgi:hypothetical protein
MWYIAIKYKSNTEDIVSSFMLDALITSYQIKQFYRPSEERWVTLGVDPVRQAETTHRDPERRRPICNDIIADPLSGSS